MAEKLWRMEVMAQISAYVRGENRQLKESLNTRHSLVDLNLYSLTKRQVLEEDIFSYFYPFCMLNCTGLTVFVLRKTSWLYMALGAFLCMEYVFFLFNFPVEAWHFHRRALSTDKPYAQLVRDSFVARFPSSAKAAMYRRIDQQEEERHAALRRRVRL